jgi:hypothetical protein
MRKLAGHYHGINNPLRKREKHSTTKGGAIQRIEYPVRMLPDDLQRLCRELHNWRKLHLEGKNEPTIAI